MSDGSSQEDQSLLTKVILTAGSIFIMATPFLFNPHPPKPIKTVIKGSFSANHESVGSWTLQPSKCLSGVERGFRGVVLQFAAGSAIRELRLDDEREGDNVVQFLFFDPNRAPVSIREKDCVEISGQTVLRIWDVNDRRVEEVDQGDLKLDCPPLQLRGHVYYKGCWP
jgi:hypothetical protein